MARTAAPANKTERTDWYAEVTAQIVSELEALRVSPKNWQKPWSGLWRNGIPRRSTGDAFSGINVWLLAIAASKAGYADPRWFTFNQAMEAAGYKKNPAWKGKADTFKGVPKFIWTGEGEGPKVGVRSGEKGTHVIRVNVIPVYVDRTSGKRVYPPKATSSQAVKAAWSEGMASGRIYKSGAYSNATSYVVFNAQQIDGLPAAMEVPVVDPAERHIRAACLVDILPITLTNVAGLYSPATDAITMPEAGQFDTVEDYWSTLLHEVIHWTGHKSRCDRTKGVQGSDDYAREELVAELGAAFLCAHLGIEGNLQHPEYLSHWIKVLQADSKLIVRLASKAQKAVDFILAGGVVNESEADMDTDEVSAAQTQNCEAA